VTFALASEYSIFHVGLSDAPINHPCSVFLKPEPYILYVVPVLAIWRFSVSSEDSILMRKMELSLIHPQVDPAMVIFCCKIENGFFPYLLHYPGVNMGCFQGWPLTPQLCLYH
jgi:hypothetical protein